MPTEGDWKVEQHVSFMYFNEAWMQLDALPFIVRERPHRHADRDGDAYPFACPFASCGAKLTSISRRSQHVRDIHRVDMNLTRLLRFERLLFHLPPGVAPDALLALFRPPGATATTQEPRNASVARLKEAWESIERRYTDPNLEDGGEIDFRST